ncbi:uncharacterized protein Z520_04223 [Fonsecaea multimorphosa CBS 102226]|uniref:NTF2-like domain-containing protein n=1 Tax=Fonsecaea multimorphosa CBS 102226 TaxID=1442371 RepID=A0A0D2HCG0_9EURO|nr:uncharacterized protein Z520_04223 [Fonsecaea multimorphosa CBS 102226]KIX99590.1 hypothetical protein Z520_04223 [Fonsecaea multimorphosa CBS 102226]OAL26830.1 hypothetical protein AYO22_03997 [Fonsecaea multimorphosa]
MKFSSIVAPLLLASTVAAVPGWRDWHDAGSKCPQSTCLTQADADDIVAKFISILDHPDVAASNATAQALLGDNFFEKSDSINMLAGHPIGAVTFSGKTQYIQGVLLAPSITNITTHKTMVAGCTNVLWYWNMAGIGSKQIPVNGFNLFEITAEKQIADMYVEFNNIGWGIDTGFTVYSRNGTKLPLA